MRKTFDAELVELSHQLTAMGTVTQDAIDLVTASLTQGKAEGAKATIEMRNTMDQMERDIENRCMSLLMRQQPVARDLRTISAAMKMVTDLQRIGDQAANIAEISLLIAESGDTRPSPPTWTGTRTPPGRSSTWTTWWTTCLSSSRRTWWSALPPGPTTPTARWTSSSSANTWSGWRTTR